MNQTNTPKIVLITEDATEEAHATDILTKYHFTNTLLKLKKNTDARKYFSAWNSGHSDSSESLPELFIMSVGQLNADNIALAVESRKGVLTKVPLILAVDSDSEGAAISERHLARTHCISRPMGFFKLLEAMQKLGMGWIVLKPLD